MRCPMLCRAAAIAAFPLLLCTAVAPAQAQALTCTTFEVGPDYYTAGPDFYSADNVRPRRAVTPRYINYGDQIVISATGRPIAPRVTETMPHEHRAWAWDNPSYRPPNGDRSVSPAAQPPAPAPMAPGNGQAVSYQRTAAMPQPGSGHGRATQAPAGWHHAERAASPVNAERTVAKAPTAAAPSSAAPHVETRPGAMAAPRGGR
jgi:hypothetical protein